MAALTAMRATRAEETPGLRDVLLAVALAAAAQVDLRWDIDNSTHYGSTFAVAVVALVATLALAFRRTWPFATLCVVAGAVAGPELVTTQTFTLWGHFVPLLVAAYTVSRWCTLRTAAVGAATAAATIAVVMLRVPAVGSVGNIPFAVVPLAVLLVAGRVLQVRQDGALALADRARRLEDDREADVAAALTAERTRIARELHDVVAHCVSVMVVQAGVAEALLDGSPGGAREPLNAVQDTGRQAIVELTRMLRLLRGSADDSPYGLDPQPGISQLPALLDRFTSSGLPVRLTSTGDARPLPPGVDLTVFRIVQEALTNTLRHAGPRAQARVEIDYRPYGVEVVVSDDGTGTAVGPGTGHGLIGMAERASVFGGVLESGPRPEGGFRVRAELPLDDR